MNNSKKNVVLCANPEKGHYFDGDSYDKCPFCGFLRKGMEDNSAEVSGAGKKQKGVMGLFVKKNKDPKSQIRSSVEIPESGSDKLHNVQDVIYSESAKPIVTPTVKLDMSELLAEEEMANDSEEYREDDIAALDINKNGHEDFPKDYYDVVNNKDGKNANVVQEEQMRNEDVFLNEQSATSETGSGLADVIKKASANTEGKTMSYFDSAKKTAEKEESRHIDPVAGWLVCVSGAHFGESFNIAAGMNSIGRSDSNRIVLDMDNSVSRDKHAFVTYEPRKRRFFVKPGDSSGLTYVNDEYITESIVLKSMDVIELGNSKFILVPLCGENFSWEDYISEE